MGIIKPVVFVFIVFSLCLSAQEIVNGQIFTAGIVIVDAPQPNTPLGGDTLNIALDVTSNGQLSLPPYGENPVSAIYNITIYLSSYETGRNFTVTNGTQTAGNGTLGDIMSMEKGSTVKHANWVWPSCLVGNGVPSGDSARGNYNISIRQNFRLNNTNLYTIFDLPIQVTNSIEVKSNRPSCDSLNNRLLSEEELKASASNFTRVAGTGIQTKKGEGLGGAGVLGWSRSVHWVWIGAFGLLFML